MNISLFRVDPEGSPLDVFGRLLLDIAGQQPGAFIANQIDDIDVVPDMMEPSGGDVERIQHVIRVVRDWTPAELAAAADRDYDDRVDAREKLVKAVALAVSRIAQFTEYLKVWPGPKPSPRLSPFRLKVAANIAEAQAWVDAQVIPPEPVLLEPEEYRTSYLAELAAELATAEARLATTRGERREEHALIVDLHDSVEVLRAAS